MTDPGDPSEDLQRIVESARRLGVELDEGDALRWLTAMAAGADESEIVVDIDSGTFGHRVSMLDLNPAQLVIGVVGAIEGGEEADVVRALLALRESMAHVDRGADWDAEVEAARTQVIDLVNACFHDRLVGLPSIADYMAGVPPR